MWGSCLFSVLCFLAAIPRSEQGGCAHPADRFGETVSKDDAISVANCPGDTVVATCNCIPESDGGYCDGVTVTADMKQCRAHGARDDVPVKADVCCTSEYRSLTSNPAIMEDTDKSVWGKVAKYKRKPVTVACPDGELIKHCLLHSYWSHNYTDKHMKATVNGNSCATPAACLRCGVQAICTRACLEIDPTDQSGHIKSPNYPANYPTGALCVWKLQGDPQSVIRFKFTEFALEQHSSCNYDSVSIYDGTAQASSRLLGKFCHAKVIGETVITDTNAAVVVFKSDGSGGRTGFYLSYKISELPKLQTEFSSGCMVGPTTEISAFIDVRWSPSETSGARMKIYELSYNGPDGVNMSLPHNKRQFRIYGLLPSTTYNVRVRAVMEDDMYKDFEEEITTVSGDSLTKPKNLHLKTLWAADSNGRILVSWDAPSIRCYRNIKYEVRYRSLPAGTEVSVPDIYQESYLIADVDFGNTYEVRVGSTSGAEIMFTDVHTISMGTRNADMAVPKIKTALTSGCITEPIVESAFIDVTWEPISEASEERMKRYELSYHGPDGVKVSLPHAKRQFRIYGLLLDTTYNVQIRTITEDYMYKDFEEEITTVSEDPSEPENLNLTTAGTTGSTGILVSWGAPSVSGCGNMKYEIRYRTLTADAEKSVPDIYQESYLITGVEFGATYEVRVGSMNAVGGNLTFTDVNNITIAVQNEAMTGLVVGLGITSGLVLLTVIVIIIVALVLCRRRDRPRRAEAAKREQSVNYACVTETETENNVYENIEVRGH